jgi:hypothetical protein
MPPTSFLYRRHLRGEEAAAFDAAPLGKLDDEIRLAKANLDAVVAKSREKGAADGIVISRGKVTSYRLYTDIIQDHLDHIRRLEEGRRKLLDQSFDDAKGAVRALMDRIEGGEFEPPAGEPAEPPEE